MNVQVRQVDYRGKVEWPDDWPIPPEGAEVTLADGRTLFVRTVVWFPQGDPDEDRYPEAQQPSPFVYLVLGASRRVGL